MSEPTSYDKMNANRDFCQEALAQVEAERDSVQEHLAYHLRDFRPGADMEATGDLAVDMAAYATRLKDRLARVEALADEWRGLVARLGTDGYQPDMRDIVGRLAAALRSDAHTEQKGEGE